MKNLQFMICTFELQVLSVMPVCLTLVLMLKRGDSIEIEAKGCLV